MTRNNENLNVQKTHKRRERYKGKYPKKFSEKYKELNPEKYGDTIQHVIEKGSTPAGMHIPIMVDEILEVLQIEPGMQGFDGTLGYGGHSQRMLEKLNGEGHLYGGDVDPIESEKTRLRLEKLGYGEKIFTRRLMNFADVDKLAQEVGLFDFVLADLGVSSMQIDNPERGFSYKQDGPLDLRMNPSCGKSAAERLRELTLDELEGMLFTNSDEPYSKEIAAEIVSTFRRGGSINTTSDLHAVVGKALEKAKISKDELKEAWKKSSARTFQALRIDVNNEYEVLYSFMEKLPFVLKPGGRAAILTFHSGEDRLVKQAFKEYKRQGIYSDISKDVIRPTAEECRRNSRAHSTKLRWAVRSDY